MLDLFLSDCYVYQKSRFSYVRYCLKAFYSVKDL